MNSQDTKYLVEGRIVKYDGSVIPPDEPIFIFRAKDKLLPEVLEFYRDLRLKNGAAKKELERMDEQLAKIIEWQKSNHTQLPSG